LSQDKEWVIEEPKPGEPSEPTENGGTSGSEQAGAGESQEKASQTSSEGGETGTVREAAETHQTELEEHEKPHEAAEDAPAQMPEGETNVQEPVQKHIKRASRKELLELLRRKNTLLLDLDAEIKKTKQDIKIKEDRLLRLAAEFENYKKRTRREWELLQKRANADLIKEIIGGIDNFDRAFANLGGVESQVHEGIKLIQTGFLDVLNRAGLKEIEALDQKFDPVLHEAIGEIESEGMEEGHVAQVVQRGYMLHDQVLRPARVMVSKKKG
jgi:molecular chaperone GrpE